MDSKGKSENTRHKGFFLLYSEINKEEPDGIERKILSQIAMFEKAGIDMRTAVLERNTKTKWIYKEEYSEVDFIYFRKSTIIDWRFIKFFERIHNNGKRPAIFMEIPTYPYDGEFGKGYKDRLSLMLDHYFRKRLGNCIDRIVVTGANVGESLWGVKAINIVNGIDFTNVKQRNYVEHGNAINISCIAKFSPWHGYERLILGLAEYYRNSPKQEVNLLMVGDGDERSMYEKLVLENGISEHVKFLGRLTGAKLNDIYNITDIGACSFGRYKSGIDVIGDLKSREFMAKGIPMICGCAIDVLIDKEYKYVLYFSNNVSRVDINVILKWYRGLIHNKDFREISDIIRKTSQNWIDYSITFKEVINETKCLWEGTGRITYYI